MALLLKGDKTNHDTLPEIVEAMAKMPRPLGRELVRVVRREGRDDTDNGMQTVQLVRHGRREGRLGVQFERRRQVVVPTGVLDPDVT
jgi:hypothetical protein